MHKTIYSDCSISPIHELTGGVHVFDLVSGDGRRIDVDPVLISSRAYRAMRPLRKSLPVAPNLIPGDFIWGGVLYLHFGHFITETLPKLLDLRAAGADFSKTRLLFLASPRAGIPDKLPDYVQRLLAIFDLSLDNFLVLDAPAKVASLSVINGTFPGKFRYAPRLASALKLPFAAQDTGHLFMSRSALPQKGSRTGYGKELDDMARRLGYTVVHPETLSLREQLELVSGAASLSGVNGSALHWALYSESLRKVQSIGWYLKLQQGICDLRGQKLVTIQKPLVGRFQGRKKNVPLSVIEPVLAAGLDR
ncbi:glycosyltransferase 61 family protein [Celeribacter sp. ULVN23_4]